MERQYSGHLQEIQSSLYVLDNFLTYEECDFLIDVAESNENYLKCRASYRPNKGLKGEIGRYKSYGIIEQRRPDIWNLITKGKEVNGFPPVEIQINKYSPGDFIPPHKDKQTSLHTVTVPLVDGPDCLAFGDPKAYYDGIPINESDEMGMTISYPDVKGTGYGFDGTTPIHWVPSTISSRYTAIFLYGILI